MEAAQGVIKPIDKASIHRICSGQVVLDLATAVKELVENSLDAGASSVEIRLKEYGAELVEVSDNGTGVSPENYQGLTLKYHTSKISQFADLQSLSSFGFRGEALSSLCALATVSIVTRTKDEPIAARLEYDRSGLIISQDRVARAVGTTVSVAKLFSPLPVRFKEFSRNIRREYGRLLSVLQGYALIAKEVRLICSNQIGRAARKIIVQTQGNSSLKDNIVTVFGTKTAACMERLELCLSDSCSVEGFVSKPGAGCGRASGDRQFFYVNGRPVDMPKVAKLLNESYRSFNSLQYPMLVLNFSLPTTAYDVNVTPDKRKLFLHSEGPLMAALKESLEKVYAPNSYTYKVNGGPLAENILASTRKLGSQANKDICLQLQAEEHKSLDGQDIRPPEDYTVENMAVSISDDVVDSERLAGRFSLDSFSFQPNARKKLSDEKLEGASETGSVSPVLPRNNILMDGKITAFMSKDKRSRECSGSLLSEEPLLKKWKVSNLIDKEVDMDKGEGSDEDHFAEAGIRSAHVAQENSECCSADPKNQETVENCGAEDNGIHMSAQMDEKISLSISAVDPYDPKKCSCDDYDEMEDYSPRFNSSVNEVEENICRPQEAKKAPQTGRRKLPAETFDEQTSVPLLKPSSTNRQVKAGDLRNELTKPRQKVAVSQLQQIEPDKCVDPAQQMEKNANQAEQPKIKNQRPIIEFDIDHHRKKLDLGLLRSQETNQKRQPSMKRRFAAATLNGIGKEGIEKETILKAATKELERSFNKADFKRMKVLGQFNLGFILAKIDEDIYIIDQHASDEKYNFEHLSKTTVLNRQPLLRPVPLELSAAEEITVLSHMELLRQNGFDFIHNEDAPGRQRLQLSAVPFSQNITFGVADVQELISLLANEPALSTSDDGADGKRPQKTFLPYPSRIRAMLASRACRSSVMIGDPLSQKEMERIVSRLSELDAPWNCPHGRPTMRHLIDLSSLKR